MTTFLEASNITLSHFLTEWSSPGMPATLVALEDLKFDKPNALPWVRMIIKQNEGRGQTIGGKGCRSFKRLGMILFQVFTPLYSGTYDGNDLCEKIIKIFEGENINNISYYNAFFSPTGPDGNWYQFNGNIEFSFSDKK